MTRPAAAATSAAMVAPSIRLPSLQVAEVVLKARDGGGVVVQALLALQAGSLRVAGGAA